MSQTKKQLAQVVLGTATAALYSAPSSGFAVVKEIFICCTTSGSVTIRLFHDSDGSTYDKTTALYYDYPVTGNDTVLYQAASDGGIVIDNIFGKIGGSASVGSAVTLTMYGEDLIS